MIRALDYLGFITLTVLLYLPVLWARWAFAVENYRKRKLGVAFFYNLIPMLFHFNFWLTGEVWFYGVVDSSPLRWMSLPIMFLHIITGPAIWGRPKRFVRKNFDPRLPK